MLIIGIDPGKQGAISIIPLYNFAATRIYPIEQMTLPDISELFHEIRYQNSEYGKDTHVEVYLEEPSLPQYNKHNGRNFNLQAHKALNRSLGQLEGICVAHNWIPNLIHPKKWQKALDCLTGGDKNISQAKAQAIFQYKVAPELYSFSRQGVGRTHITQVVADALLIALYGYLQYANPKYIPSVIRENVPAESLPKHKETNSEERNDVYRIEQPRPRSVDGSDSATRRTRRPRTPSAVRRR